MNEEILYRIRIIDEASKTIKKVENALRNLGNTANISKLKNSIDNMNKALKQTADSMQSVGLRSGLALGITTKKLYDFEKQMNIISAISGKTQQELQGFKNKAVELGASTQYTTTQVAELGVVFARAGFSVSDTTSLLSDTLNMASAGNITLEESASLMANSIKSYKMQVTDASKLADVFSKSANLSNMTILDFNDMVSKTGAISQLAGIELEKTSAMFGVLRDNSLDASVASTGLGATIMRLSGRTSEVRKALAGLNINQEKFIKMPFDKKLELLATKHLDLATASQLFGMEHAKTSLVLLANLKQVDEKYNLIKNSSGSANKSQQAMMQGLVGAFERFRSALDGVIFSLGEGGLTGKLETSFNFLTLLLNKFNNSSPMLKSFIGNILILGSSLLVVSVAIRTIMFMSIGLKVILSALNGVILLYSSRILILNGVLKAWSIFNGILTGSMALLNLSLLPVIATIIAVASTIYLLYQGYKKIMSIINKDKKEENKINAKQGNMQSSNIEDNTDASLSKLFNLSQSMNSNNAPPKGEINIKVEATNNAKAESTILKQSGLKLGVQQ